MPCDRRRRGRSGRERWRRNPLCERVGQDRLRNRIGTNVLAPILSLVLGPAIMVLVSWICVWTTPRRVDLRFRRLQWVSAALYSLGHGDNDAQAVRRQRGLVCSQIDAAPAINCFRDAAGSSCIDDDDVPRIPEMGHETNAGAIESFHTGNRRIIVTDHFLAVETALVVAVIEATDLSSRIRSGGGASRSKRRSLMQPHRLLPFHDRSAIAAH